MCKALLAPRYLNMATGTNEPQVLFPLPSLLSRLATIHFRRYRIRKLALPFLDHHRHSSPSRQLRLLTAPSVAPCSQKTAVVDSCRITSYAAILAGHVDTLYLDVSCAVDADRCYIYLGWHTQVGGYACWVASTGCFVSLFAYEIYVVDGAAEGSC